MMTVALHITKDITTHQQLREELLLNGIDISGEVRFECACRDELVFEKLEDIPLHDLKMPCDERHWAIIWDRPYLFRET